MDEILSSIPNVTPVADDIKIHGRTERDHDLTLLQVLDKCQSAGLHINLEKFQIKKQSVKFYGNMLTTDGLQPDKTKVDAIVKLAPPTNKHALRSLVGIVTYLVGSKIPVPDCLSRLIHSCQDPEIHGMHIQVNDVALTYPSNLDIIRNHIKKDEDLLLLRDIVLRR